jgi:putative acetyltransferase
MGYSEVILETGILQHEAIRFYTKSGYKPIDNFGPYIGNRNSVCMMKNLKAL